MEILIVSHSEDVAKGTKVLLEQMAKDVVVKTTGGINGEIGTSIDDIIEMFDSVEGEAICFYDIGSSKMNIEMALEMNDYSNIHIAHYPVLEGAFLASVESILGKNTDEIFESLAQNFKEKIK
ncbi:dihydroxyacetone kinase phosphoryl donor subunit DhaM [Macrococcus armenti]|uniref:dihydroxyacetone kinase phosphoryl donor subunit DhaM n=1 Tax=Macrococcus armenti TaxID=2875764 RepID=UPI001CCEAFA4|nr:dihydroxyacetone kinase phosphoryl donor subunit DhaM [Macrococcus armenti]UBH09051.1 PTS-dependent dihydroxyacetone kinase phosphotransferase subunit DhaM [Macrococcus armenti]UBH11344.1 PTS-dependent dihydroxyacetone kinase phosphotransferase subunit DhaM [Macrococcus armenti]